MSSTVQQIAKAALKRHYLSGRGGHCKEVETTIEFLESEPNLEQTYEQICYQNSSGSSGFYAEVWGIELGIELLTKVNGDENVSYLNEIASIAKRRKVAPTHHVRILWTKKDGRGQRVITIYRLSQKQEQYFWKEVEKAYAEA